MAVERAVYRPRDAERSVLHAVVRTHLETFLREAAHRGEGAGLPQFVEQEFREFLTCGVLAHGFVRLRCDTCAEERLVPFSCKGAGFCPSCGGRRMTERAAHLVENVLPRVPVRQWVLSLPHWLRYLLAWDHRLCRGVLGILHSGTPGLLPPPGPPARPPGWPHWHPHRHPALRRRPQPERPLPHSRPRRGIQRPGDRQRPLPSGLAARG